eukprot:1373807-Amorphochlora_amoeboformis.AAC.3
MYALGFLAILMASQTKISYLYVIGLLLLAAAPCCTYLTGLARYEYPPQCPGEVYARGRGFKRRE